MLLAILLLRRFPLRNAGFPLRDAGFPLRDAGFPLRDAGRIGTIALNSAAAYTPVSKS
jgi:hypothetical protein